MAFSHLLHKDIGIFELQLALMYRPKNSHCIYVDRKAATKTLKAATSIVGCYKEAFLQVMATHLKYVMIVFFQTHYSSPCLKSFS